MGATLIAIAKDSQADLDAHAAKNGITFPLRSDPNLQAIHAFGVADDVHQIALPAVLVVDRRGIVRWIAIESLREVRPDESVVIGELRKAL